MGLLSNGIEATYFAGEASGGGGDDPREIFRELGNRNSIPRYKLVYITPERIDVSQTLDSIMTSLYERKLLERIVIDEAHCVSQWLVAYLLACLLT